MSLTAYVICDWSRQSFREEKPSQSNRMAHAITVRKTFVILPAIKAPPVTEGKTITVFVFNLGLFLVRNIAVHTLP